MPTDFSITHEGVAVLLKIFVVCSATNAPLIKKATELSGLWYISSKSGVSAATVTPESVVVSALDNLVTQSHFPPFTPWLYLKDAPSLGIAVDTDQPHSAVNVCPASLKLFTLTTVLNAMLLGTLLVVPANMAAPFVVTEPSPLLAAPVLTVVVLCLVLVGVTPRVLPANRKWS